ncbi:hypothetical protein AMTRI_Chr12g269760 [Amborella trichopoda]
MSRRSKKKTRISDKNKRHVSFSNKGAYLRRLGGKLFTYGSPSIDDIITKYLQGPQLLHESHWKHLQYLSTLHSKIQKNSHEDLTSTSSLPYSMDLIHQQFNVEMGCSFGLFEINDLNHRGSINAMNVCFSNGECEAIFSCPRHEGTKMSSSLDFINYMNSYLCNGESRPQCLYPQDENIVMGGSFGSEISGLNHHGSINDMNVYRNNGVCELLFMCLEDEGT